MVNKSNKNLIGFFALFMTGLVLFGCASQPQAPVPSPRICSTDLYACQDGSFVARDPANNCQFTACSEPTVCARDLYACPDGTSVARIPAKDCQFAACPPPAACTQEAKLCYGGSYVSRNSSKNCAFDACPIVIIPAPQQNNTNQTPYNSSLAAEGETCAGVAGIKCQSGLQCIISGQIGAEGSCTAPAPPLQDLQQCPTERYASCTIGWQINPVCGKAVTNQAAFRDYANPCEACSTESNAIGYYMGTCENQ